MTGDGALVDVGSASLVALRVAPIAVATSFVGLKSLPRSAIVALFAAVAIAIAPAVGDLRGGAALALAQGLAVAAGALVPLVTATMTLDATARLAELPASWNVYFSGLIALSFLLMGGPADVAAALIAPSVVSWPDALAASLARGAMAGLSLAAPMLVARVGVDVLFATAARAPLGTVWVSARKLALWTIVALLARRLVFRAL